MNIALNITRSEAEHRAQHVLSRFRPNREYHLFPINPRAEENAGVVFRARPDEGGQTLVVKVFGHSDEARRKVTRQFRRQRQVHAALRNAEAGVPRPMYLDDVVPAMVMQNIPGMSFFALWTASRLTELSEHAGRWLSRYHAISETDQLLDTAPMLAWLDRFFAEHPDAHLLEAPGFTQARRRVETLARLADGQPVQHSIIHGDYHAANLVLDHSHRVFGLDFENRHHDIALRDAFSFILDVVLNTGADVEECSKAFRAGYGLAGGTPPVLRFADAYLATIGWARLGVHAHLRPRRQARLALLERVAMGDSSLLWSA